MTANFTNSSKEIKTIHPSPKPITLLLRILRALQPKTVLDPFFGSGTVGVVCENLDRKYHGIELKKEYIDISKKRIINVTRQPSLFST